MNDVLAAFQADIQPLGLTLHAGVWDCAERRWVLGEGPHHPDDVGGFGDTGYVLSYPNGTRGLLKVSSGGPDLVDAISVLQDWVIDELWRGWPERYSDAGEFSCLLQPVAGLAGEVWWADHGTPVARLGELATVTGIR